MTALGWRGVRSLRSVLAVLAVRVTARMGRADRSDRSRRGLVGIGGTGRKVGIGEGGARLMRACAGTPPPGTEVNGRATRVHDFLGLRLASTRYARGAPPHVPSVALPAARAELGFSSIGRAQRCFPACHLCEPEN